MKKAIFIIGLLLSFNLSAQYKAESFDSALLEAKYGAMIVFNGQANSFTLKVISPEVKPTEQPGFLMAGNKLLQAKVIPFQQKFDFKSLTEEKQKELLTGFKNYEKKYVEDQLKMKLQEKEEFLDLNGKIFKYWSYDMPKKNKSIAKQVYLITICFDQILILNGPVQKGQSEEELQNLLVSVAKTLETNPNKTQDLDKLFYDLKK